MSRALDLSVARDLEVAIDRLVANELDAGERRALLLHLDGSPAGWRRCALAFVEDQALRSALTGQPTALLPPVAFELVPPQKRRRLAIRRAATYALAASVALSFVTVAFRANNRQVERKAEQQVTQVSPPVTVPVADELTPGPGQPVGWVKLVNPAEGEALPRQVPILAATAANEQWLKAQPATIPEYVRTQWERRGYQVEESHRLVGLDLNDGRRVAIPVDEVALDFVGRQPL